MHGLVLVVLAAAPANVKVAMPGLHLVDVPADRGAFYTEQLATELISRGLRVVTEREIAALLGLERQKEILGCAEGSCMIELANALGVDGVVLGQVARVGTHFQVSLRVIDAKSGVALAVTTYKAENEEALVDGLNSSAKAIDDQLHGRAAPGASAPVASTSGGLPIPRRMWWAPAIGAALVLGGGAACLVVSRGDYAHLDPQGTTPLKLADAQATASRGSALQTTAVALLATGAALAVGTIAVGIFGSRTQVSVAITPQGATVAFAGSLP